MTCGGDIGPLVLLIGHQGVQVPVRRRSAGSIFKGDRILKDAPVRVAV